ncbi:MAG: RNA polymerase factor sigma-32 [Alphaproteobacteria bacterium]
MGYMEDTATLKANVQYIRASMKEKLLERDEEQDLAILWRNNGDEKALHTIIRSYSRLVVAMAARFRHYGLPMGDLIQEGNVGIMQAAARFDPSRDVRFSTYAAWWIRSAIQDYVLRNWSIVRTGSTAAQKSLFFNLRRLKAKIADHEPGQPLTREQSEDIATVLQVSVQEVMDMEQRLSGGDHSLNAMIGEEGSASHQDFLVDSAPNPEEKVILLKDTNTYHRWLYESLNNLSEREKEIITARKLNEENITLQELGTKLGISKERVRQLEERAMKKLRVMMEEKMHAA